MTMLHGVPDGQLEVRAEADGTVTLSGSFPYNATATLSRGGRSGKPRKERFAPRAFSYNIEQADVDINLLSGHDFNRPLASKLNGSIDFDDTDEALNFTARISPNVAQTSHGKDTLALIESGLATGISPGFAIPPRRTAPDAERVTTEPDNPDNGENGATIRTINAALLYELSIVTRPAFEQAQVEARNWMPDPVTAPSASKYHRRLWGIR